MTGHVLMGKDGQPLVLAVCPVCGAEGFDVKATVRGQVDEVTVGLVEHEPMYLEAHSEIVYPDGFRVWPDDITITCAEGHTEEEMVNEIHVAVTNGDDDHEEGGDSDG